MTVKIGTIANGIFTAASLTASGFTSTGNPGEFQTTGTASAVTTAIRQLVFRPTQNQVPPRNTVTTNFLITVSNGIAPAVTDNTTSVVATAVAGLPFSDSFDRANAANLGSNWTNQLNGFSIVSNKAQSAAGTTTTLSIATLNGVSVANVTLQASVSVAAGSGPFALLVARFADPADMVFGGLVSRNGQVFAEVYRKRGGVDTMIGSSVAVTPEPTSSASWRPATPSCCSSIA